MSGMSFTRSEAVIGLYDACVTIEGAGGCDRCPLRYCCLDTTSYMQVCEEATVERIDEFLDLADDIESIGNEDDMIAYYADMARKAERDEYYD